jgi:hypothetical protein
LIFDLIFIALRRRISSISVFSFSLVARAIEALRDAEAAFWKVVPFASFAFVESAFSFLHFFSIAFWTLYF